LEFRSGRYVAVLLAAVTAVVSGFQPTPTLAAEYDHLLRRIPDEVNTLILLNVESIFASELAQAENWQQTYSDNFAAAPLIVPPRARQFVLGAAVDIESMHPRLEVASMEVSTDPTIDEIAARIGGPMDELSGLPVVWPRDNLCIVKFSPSQFGVISPASRQEAARWTADVQRRSAVGLSPYLQQAARYAASAGPEIIMAIDLAHVLRQEAIRSAVEQSDLFQSRDGNQVAAILGSLRGITLGVRVTDRIYGKLLVDFGQDASILEPVAKQLILRVLTSTGAMIDEVNDWKGSAAGNRIALEGPLTTEGMRRLFSLTTLDSAVIARSATPAGAAPPPKPAAAKDLSTPQPDPQEAIAAASLRYFRSISRYLNDLQKPRRSNELSDIALWMNNFGRRIQRLPVHNVDPDLRAYGQMVVDGLNDAVGYVQSIDARTLERQAQVQPESGVSAGQLPTGRVIQYGPYVRYREYVPFFRANVDIGSTESERNQIAQEEYETGTDAARQIMEHLQSETRNIRATMTQRYGREF
jgi:hypothetical protein